MPDIRVQDENGTIHVFPDGSTPEMIADALGVKPPDASATPGAYQTRKGGPVLNANDEQPVTLGTRFGNAARFMENQLPVAGMIGGGLIGGVPGAALGAAAGAQTRRLIKGQPTTNREALTETGAEAASGATAEMGGQIIGKGVEVASPYVGRAIGAVKGGTRKAVDLVTGTRGAVQEAEAARAAELAAQQEAIRARGIGVRQNLAKLNTAKEELAATNAAKQSEYQTDLAAAQAKIPAPAPGEQQEWIKLNKSIQATASGVKTYLKSGANDFADVMSMPGRGLAEEGIKAEQLAKMSPLEQNKVIDPIITKAGKAVNKVAKEATEKGVKVDLYTVDEAVSSMEDPIAREGVQKVVNRIGKDLGIRNWGEVTPTQALELRRALYDHGGDNAEFISRAITKQLREAVPESQAVDRHFTDLAGAREAVRRATARYAVGKWRFPDMEPKMPEAPTPKELKMPRFKSLMKVPETPAPVDESAIRKEQLKKAGKKLTIGATGIGLYEAGKHYFLRGLMGGE